MVTNGQNDIEKAVSKGCRKPYFNTYVICGIHAYPGIQSHRNHPFPDPVIPPPVLKWTLQYTLLGYVTIMIIIILDNICICVGILHQHSEL